MPARFPASAQSRRLRTNRPIHMTKPTVVTRQIEARFMDDRGQTAVILDGSDAVTFLEYLDFGRSGAVRGSHYHENYVEQFFVVEGELVGEFADFSVSGSPSPSHVILPAGSLTTIPPRVAHRFTSTMVSRAIAFGSGSSPLTDRTMVAPEVWSDQRAVRGSRDS
jgi:mannose-6-phosphate isomerase-like protein (cupin superfamily)